MNFVHIQTTPTRMIESSEGMRGQIEPIVLGEVGRKLLHFPPTRFISSLKELLLRSVFQMINYVITTSKYFSVNKILDTDAYKDSNAHEGYSSDTSFWISECIVDFRKYEVHKTYH